MRPARGWIVAIVGVGCWFASPVWASVGLSWSDCLREGTSDRSFACDTEEGTDVLVVTVNPSYSIAAVSQVVIEISFSSLGGIPEWWQIASAGCRQEALTVSTDFSNPPFESELCAVRAWTTAPSVSVYPAGTNKLLVDLQFGALRDSLVSGRNYYVCRLILDRQKTLGAGACGGCGNQVSMSAIASIVGSAGVLDEYYGETATWQWYGAGLRPAPAREAPVPAPRVAVPPPGPRPGR